MQTLLPGEMTYNGKSIKNVDSIVNGFREYFSSVFHIPSESIFHQFSNITVKEILVSEQDILTLKK